MEKNDVMRKKKLRQFGIIQMIFIIMYVWIIGYVGRNYFRNSESFNTYMWIFNIVYVVVCGIIIFKLRIKKYDSKK
jgi:hypothetical protein